MWTCLNSGENKNEIEYLQKKIASFDVLENALQKKKAALAQTSNITAKKYQLEINRLVTDMKAMDEQYDFQKERFHQPKKNLQAILRCIKKICLANMSSTRKGCHLAGAGKL